MASRSKAAIMNFLLWGLGYVYQKEKVLYGIGWILAFIPMHIPFIIPGLEYSYMESRGVLLLLGHFMISVLLAYDAFISERNE